MPVEIRRVAFREVVEINDEMVVCPVRVNPAACLFQTALKAPRGRPFDEVSHQDGVDGFSVEVLEEFLEDRQGIPRVRNGRRVEDERRFPFLLGRDEGRFQLPVVDAFALQFGFQQVVPVAYQGVHRVGLYAEKGGDGQQFHVFPAVNRMDGFAHGRRGRGNRVRAGIGFVSAGRPSAVSACGERSIPVISPLCRS